jgi:rSAM/selenodomain-associated transferase 2
VTVTISVIIPAIDEAEVIGAAVSSAVRAGADEVILVDGGSSDATPRIAEQHGALVLTALPGRASQQNAGAHAAKGDLLLFLHADCCLPEDGLDEIRQQMAACKSRTGGFFRQRIDHAGWIYRWIEFGNLFRARTLKWAYGDQAIFVRSNVYHAIGGFPKMPLMEDLYFMKRLKREGQLVCIQAPLVVSARRWTKRGTIRQTLRNWTMLVAVHLGVSPNTLARFYPRTT